MRPRGDKLSGGADQPQQDTPGGGVFADAPGAHDYSPVNSDLKNS